MAARVSQEVVEVLVAPSAQRARVSQVVAEALVAPDTQRARVSQLTAEVLVNPTEAPPALGRTQVVVAG